MKVHMDSLPIEIRKLPTELYEISNPDFISRSKFHLAYFRTFAALFNLTPTEVKIMAEICKMGNLLDSKEKRKEIAESIGISRYLQSSGRSSADILFFFIFR